MSLRKLTAGDGYSYLTRQVAAHDTTERGSSSLADYYEEKGESPGRWLGAGLASLDLTIGDRVAATQMASLFGQGHHPRAGEIEAEKAARRCTPKEIAEAVALGRAFAVRSSASAFNVRVAQAFTAHNVQLGQKWNAPIRLDQRARIRTEIGAAMFADAHGRPPQDARELSGFIAKASRQATSAIAGFDLSFSPVKSVSALWALAPLPVAAEIRAAHETAVAQTLAWLEREVAYTRVGRAGSRQVKVRGLVAAAFTHRDSRSGDPDLHTHVAVSNKVQTEDGRWLALDGRLLYAAKVAASENYNTRLEAELVARLGVEFAERDAGTPGKRPVREVRGVSTSLTRYWSRRRADIVTRQSQLAAEFQRSFGRPPTAIEALWHGEQATLESRAAKHEPRSEADQRAAWRAEADDILGDPAEVDEMYARVTHRGVVATELTQSWVAEAASATIRSVEGSRATWNVWHLTAEAQRRARSSGIAPAVLDRAIDQVVEAAISQSVRLGVEDPIVEPAALRRGDGESMYDVHGAALYTSVEVLAAEQEILSLAATSGAHSLSEARVEVALKASAARGLELNDAQAAMVSDLALSGSTVQLALAPAGTGKTTAMSVLAEAWSAAGGHVVGLAPSAQAAHELSQALSGHTDTLAKLTWTIANETSAAWPGWIREIGPKSLVIIDEAGQAATTELASALRFVAGRGGAVRLIGDDQQLAAVGAGGVLRDLQEQVGAATLSQVRRFNDPAEAAATLAAREGDAGALGFYADNFRIHVGDLGTVADQAYEAWAADRAAGIDSVLLAPTRELVGQLNARARASRLSGAPSDSGEVNLADGNCASAGDIVVTRRNSRRLVISRSDWVKNGDRWCVEQVDPDGSLVARHLDLRRLVQLPASYVAEHVQLGYATTVHGAQGMTADSAHLVATGEETRQTMYVGLSRGRTSNHIYLATGHDGDRHSLIDSKTLRPPTAIDVLAEVLGRDGSDRSATTTQRESTSVATQLHQAVMRFQDALGSAAEEIVGAEQLAAVEGDIEAIWPGLTSEPAYPTLKAHLCLRSVDGDDPLALLTEATNARELGTSNDRAAVLEWRLGASPTRGPLPWLDAIPERLSTDPTWGRYLADRAERVRSLSETLRAEATAWSPTTTPAWASGLTSADCADLRGDLAVWRGAFAVVDSDVRPTGAAQSGTAASTHQDALNRRARALLGGRRASESLLERLPGEVCTDPHFARLSQRLAALESAQVDVDGLLTIALAHGQPLPDERAADALWWRLVRHLGPAALRASGDRASSPRPAWSAYLCARVGQAVGGRVMEDAMWPALVAAVRARPPEWTAEQLLDAATSGNGSEMRAEDLCTALVWRIAMMTDAPFDEPEVSEPEFDGFMGEPAELVDAGSEQTAPSRILELNRWTLEHYRSLLGRSWAPDYLTERLGTDLASDARFLVGYASPGPTTLIRHLSARGATAQELIDAGLARETERGRLIDTFRDRLVFPILSDRDLVGFVGRRNPTKPDSEFSGPKYLNTRATAVFTKGEQLFGLTECAADLKAGGVPVIVEGPVDAIAATLASGGDFVGVAPLGTALTERQAAQLKPYVADDPSGIVIATDGDTAGWDSARRTFWRLAALGANPRHLSLPAGMDPADLLRTEGTTGLARRLASAAEFATELIDRLLEEELPQHSGAFARVDLARAAARIIGALPPARWVEAARDLAERLDLSLSSVQEEIYEAGRLWTDEPDSCVARELARLRPSSGHATRPLRFESMGISAEAPEDPARRTLSPRARR